MGLGSHMVEAIIREHLHRPIAGDVLTIGRQTIYYDAADLVSVLQDHGVTNIDRSLIEIDRSTIDRKGGHEGKLLVTDRSLFRVLGSRKVAALDHSDYEDADVIHDLKYPLPEHLEAIADFIVDGSTLDNVFAPSVVLQNYARLLRPGGRLLMTNAFSPYDSAYAIMPPLWYVDYFVVNGFAACHAYVLVYMEGEQKTEDNVFVLDLDHLYEAKRHMPRFISPHHMVTVIFAEKAPQSTSDVLPNQQDYRSAKEWDSYLANLDAMRRNNRHLLVRSHSPNRFTPCDGHRFVDTNFVAV
jgi:SAM-dependent methyltransferase